MDFYKVLDQIIELLKHRGRVSYRALKMQFELSDDGIEALKDELIYAQQVAVDEDDRVLVWAGEAERLPESTFTPPTQPSEQPTPHEAQSTQVEVPPIESHTPNAERRQLTVMFCDLTDSTRLSSQLDPEDLRDVIRAYQSTSAEVIERYDGYIAQHLGDGLMVYFGWPQAHEDDTQRAVHAGLGILEAMQGLNAHLDHEQGIRLAIRIGIHTGLVVVGEIGSGASQEHLALGKTPNVASRIEGIAEHDTVAISDATYQLVQGYFVCNDLGQHRMKGVDDPQHVYQVVKESDTQSRLDVATARGLTPLVGRESESALLCDRWQRVKDGQGQVVLLSGEAGIGKSRLLQVLRDHVAHESHLRLECRSSPYSQNTALHPIIDLMQRSLEWQPDDMAETKVEKLEQMLRQYRLPLSETVPLFATLLSLPLSEDHYPPLNMSPQQQRQKTLESIVAMLLEQAECQPVLFILEDLHWTDPTTLELLDLIVDHVPTVSLLTLLTCRPEFEPSWGLRSHLTPIALNRFTRTQIETMVNRLTAGKSLPAEVMQHLTEKTDGVPLYVEEMTKAIVESGALQATNGHYELTAPLGSLAIPMTLQDSLMARLDRLGISKSVAQLGAVLGRTFTYELLQAVSSLDVLVVWQSLAELVRAELLYQRGSFPEAVFTFKHALVQDAAYQSLLRRTRQQHHECIAQVLEARFPETVEMQPELIAHHCTEAGLYEQAMEYWQRAGQHAQARAGYQEAIHHLTRGLEVLKELPDTPERTQREFDLRLALVPPLMTTKGYAAPEVEQLHARIRDLSQQVGEELQLVRVLRGLWTFYNVSGQRQKARDVAEQILELSQRFDDPVCLIQMHVTAAGNLFFTGDFVSAVPHLEQVLALCQTPQHRSRARYVQDPSASQPPFLILARWYLGYPDQALRREQELLDWVRQLERPHDLAFALTWTTLFRYCLREEQTVIERTEELIALCTERGIGQLLAIAQIFQGAALATQGQASAGIAQMRQALDAHESTGARLHRVCFFTLLAEAYGKSGQMEEGLAALAKAITLLEQTEERYYEAELHRLRGILLWACPVPNPVEAENAFRHALAVARRQHATSWELRAATSLARLWQAQGKRQDAHDLLAPVYGWFTEGFDTADLQEAKALLHELEA